jgi:hypothetical protein
VPSTSKKQHNFMAAIANNPSFAKKVGVSQSVGKDFSAADKGRKFNKGGATMMSKKAPNAMSAMMARRRMGAGMPPPAPPVMPPQPPAPMGMKKGGKVYRFKEGGITEGPNKNIDNATRARALAFVNKPKEDGKQSFGAAFAAARKAGDSTFVWKGDKFTTKIDEEKKTPPPKPAAPSNKDARDRKLDDSGTSLNAYRGMAADEQAALRKREPMKANVQSDRKYDKNMDARDRNVYYAKESTPEYEKEFTRTGVPPRVDEEGSMMDVPKFAKGGSMKFAKGGMAHGGMHKMPNGKMMKNSAMKEGGMPMKDGKPAFMMGKKKMMGGGMAKYAKGGGIESRGKTKGTMIRMAAGGSVSARADGIAQRGKTRG